MKHKMFSIFDVKAQAYLPPFCLHETAMAVRSFSDCVNSGDHAFGRHPGDYTLFELGSFDDSVCVVSCTPSAMKVVNGLEVVLTEDAGPVPLKFIKGDGGYEGFVKERSDETA